MITMEIVHDIAVTVGRIALEGGPLESHLYEHDIFNSNLQST